MTAARCRATSQVRPEVMDFSPYSAGLSIDEIKERYGLDTVVKLASNENPLGASPLVQQVIRSHAGHVFRYAQSGNPRLARSIADFFGLPAECVVTGNGSDEVIDLLIRAKARPGLDNIVAFDPCFSMYTVLARLCGVELRQTPLNENFSFNWDALVALTDENTAIVFVTTPDNPSGYTPPVEEIATLAGRLPEQCLLVVDEAYMDFTGDRDAYSMLPRLMQHPNVCVLRTFSKSMGLAGLRLGFGAMQPELADYLKRIRPPFSVNILAEHAGMAALEDTVFYNETLRVTAEGRDYLNRELTALGCSVYPSRANFIMFQAPMDGGELHEQLLRRGIILRPLNKGYGLPRHMRVSVGSKQENAAFIAAFREILHAR